MNNENNKDLFPLLAMEAIASVLAEKIPYKFGEIFNGLNLKNHEKIERADAIESLVPLKADEENYIDNVLFKAVVMLEALGYTGTAKELSLARNILKIEKNHREEIVGMITKDAIKRQYSKAASTPRNKLHDEIVNIIKATWERHPTGSKKEMIRRIMDHYPGQVDESTLKRWIKKSNLTPSRPRKYQNFSLVFP
ncbi:hypothetical protein AAH211_21455 [Serratia fonticola]|uniref:hypothetical protein n=1 Tax=Serratia fonticola TaxID=47917 RepID=UPI003987EFE6